MQPRPFTQALRQWFSTIEEPLTAGDRQTHPHEPLTASALALEIHDILQTLPTTDRIAELASIQFFCPLLHQHLQEIAATTAPTTGQNCRG